MTRSPADFAERPVVLYESGANTRLPMDRWAVRAGVSLKSVMELGGVAAIRSFADEFRASAPK